MSGKQGASILVTGGAGYVGSHTVLVLLEHGYQVVVVDNLVNVVPGEGDKPESLLRVEKLTGKNLTFYKLNLGDIKALDKVFLAHEFDCVIHFAALKAVGESCEIPLTYYENNVGSSITLLEVMRKHGVKRLVFSSSATVYGVPKYLPLDERHITGQGCTNPYGRSKYFIEEILSDLCLAEKDWQVISLRYFNPVGAHESGAIGEDPQGIPNNLMPYVAQVAVGKRAELTIFGNDYDTKDGTGVRDYIHIMDLAEGHLAALAHLLPPSLPSFGFQTFNLGTGAGHSVLEVVRAFEEASGRNVPYRIAERRTGDVAASYADCKRAKAELKWEAKRTLLDMCKDTWNWQSKNPNGYRKNVDN